MRAMSDMAIVQPSKPPAIAKPKRMEVRGKLRGALNRMVWEGETYDVAAKAFNFTVAAMRKALQRPHVLAYLRNEREVLRASVSARNIHRLVEIRDKAENMPAVNAIGMLERLGDETHARSTGSVALPGLTIQIINASPDTHVNASLTRSDAKPLIEQAVGSHDRDD